MNNITFFEITAEHLKLLKHSYITWWDCEYGAPSIDPKKPYGNSYVEHDIAKILGWKLNEDNELSDEQINLANKIHSELKLVLQICLCTQSFEPGKYIKQKEYSNISWTKFDDVKPKNNINFLKLQLAYICNDLKNIDLYDVCENGKCFYCDEYIGDINTKFNDNTLDIYYSPIKTVERITVNFDIKKS